MTEETKEKTTLANATVILEGKRNSFTGETGETGNVDFTKLPPDTYTLLVQKEGYEDYVHKKPIKIDEKKYNNIQLNIKLKPLETEQETTTDEEDTTRTIIIETEPVIEGAEINLLSDNKIIKTTTTDNTGSVTFEDVQFGSYTIQSNTVGYEEVTKNITINSNNKNPRTISISFVETTNNTEE